MLNHSFLQSYTPPVVVPVYDYTTPGTLWAWGTNTSGQLGIGLYTNQSVPVQVGTFTNHVTLSASGSQGILTVLSNGDLYVAGRTTYGQLFMGSVSANPAVLTKALGSNWKMVWGNGFTSIGVRNDGTLWGCGMGNYGQVGNNSNSDVTTPVQIGTTSDWTNTDAPYSNCDQYASAIVKADGTLWVWGLNTSGELGLGDTTNRIVPTRVGTATDWHSVSQTTNATLALKKTGELYVSGTHVSKLGLGATTTTNNTFVRLGTALWKQVRMGFAAAIGIQIDGSLWVWGAPSAGLGDGNATSTSTVPIKLNTGLTYKKAVAWDQSFFAIDSTGALWAWGANGTAYQLGLGDTANRSVPTRVGTGNNWRDIDFDYSSGFGIRV